MAHQAPRSALEPTSEGAKLAAAAFLKDLHARVISQVRDCNAVCGRRLWVISSRSQDCFVVRAEDDADDCVEVTIDKRNGDVSYRLGQHSAGPRCDGHIPLNQFTVEDAVALILAGLRFPGD